MCILEVSELCKAYPSFQLRDVSFSLKEGRITGLVGRNGAGKTTVLKSILGFLHPDRGEITFFGGTPFEGNEQAVKQDIGYLSGGVSFYPNKKLRVISGVTRRFYRNWDEAAYRDCLTRFGLDENKTPAQLSEGMKVKYALTLALSHRARLLILDEPTSGLDPVSREELLDLFLELQDRGVTILFSTHIISDLEKCADDLIYLQKGRIRAQGDLKAFAAGYQSVTLTQAERDQADATQLIGCKRSKEGFTALARTGDATAGNVPGTICPASLETILVHLEQEETL